ncbi:MAG: uracil-DNA glycosylase, partial [Cereibacter changlensis]
MDRLDHDTAAAMLLWQVDLGVTEALLDAPLNRYDLAEPVRAPAAPAARVTAEVLPMAAPDPVAEARALADAAEDLEALRAAMTAYEHCELKRGARNTVFSDGHPAARVMVIGEAPGRDEDTEGRPFVGRAGQLLDRMLAAIGLGRESPDPARAIYITNVM